METVEGGIFDSSFRDNFRPEVDSDVISGVAIKQLGVNIRVEFGDSKPNRSRDIRVAGFVMDNDVDCGYNRQNTPYAVLH